MHCDLKELMLLRTRRYQWFLCPQNVGREQVYKDTVITWDGDRGRDGLGTARGIGASSKAGHYGDLLFEVRKVLVIPRI